MTTPENKDSSGNRLAITLSLLASAVSVLVFGMTVIESARGSDVTLFPIEDVVIFGYPDGQNALGISLQTEMTNLASERFPDAITDQRVEFISNSTPFACLAARGEIGLTVEKDDPVLPEQGAAAPAIEAKPDNACSDAECVRLSGLTLHFRDGPTRHAIAAGAVTSLRQVFDGLAIPSGSACRTIGTTERSLAQFVKDARAGALILKYHLQTLRDGDFEASCTLSLNPDDLDGLAARGWGFYPCLNPLAARAKDQRGFGAKVKSFFSNLFS